ncbi:hypothetical protein [Granulicella paludicola]|uniref:hypothetical protein n=1 Tax=Granulicella paludicola TaxID=474951 RepID=UPI0021DFB887|nr:hypothetical protein [Granulicella paludicola]
MRQEFANRITDRTIKSPTPAEYTEAARRGKALSSQLLTEIRSDARAAKRSKVVVAAAPVSANPALIAKLRAKIESLSQENTKLKVKIITG